MPTPAPLSPAIVLVDDEPHIRLILQRVLLTIADGYDLIAVGTGAAALEALDRRLVPLLITDYNMPGMNGLELIHKYATTRELIRSCFVGHNSRDDACPVVRRGYRDARNVGPVGSCTVPPRVAFVD